MHAAQRVVLCPKELYDKRGEKPVNTVDGWNAWFFRDAQNLSRAWPEIGTNRSDVLELWLGFLRYYYDGFDDKVRLTEEDHHPC